MRRRRTIWILHLGRCCALCAVRPVCPSVSWHNELAWISHISAKWKTVGCHHQQPTRSSSFVLYSVCRRMTCFLRRANFPAWLNRYLYTDQHPTPFTVRLTAPLSPPSKRLQHHDHST